MSVSDAAPDPNLIDAQILSRYEIINKIGQGTYGIVWRVRDRLTNATVAMKKAVNAFKRSSDAQRIYREVSYLASLRKTPNIITLLAVHRSENDNDLYLIFELMETDLWGVIRGGILQPIHRQYIFWQLLCGLKYIHSANIIHRDLKPSNILVNTDSSIKICDFGLSRTIGFRGEDELYTDYVATRWYRPPEIILGAFSYHPAVDMWAAGCILAELISGRPLFPGSSPLDQLERIVSFTGRPTESDRKVVHSPVSETLLGELTFSYEALTFECGERDAEDLVKKLIVFDPEKRLSAEECLEHPYVGKFHRPSREPVARRKIVPVLDDGKKYTVRDYRNQTYREAVTAPDLPSRRQEDF
jgi:mitogen-activated protein kinase 15